MDSDSSEDSGSFVVHSEGSGSVVVHDVPDDSGLSAPFTNGGASNGAGGGGGGSHVNGGRGVGGGGGSANGGINLAAMIAGIGRGGRTNAGPASLAGGMQENVPGDVNAAEAGLNARRLPRPKPVLRWSQVPQDARPSPAPYLMNRYGRGAGAPAGPMPGPGLGDSLDAFKLYVADDGEMKMGDHHNDFYGFNYDPADDTDDLVNLQQRQLSANGGGGDFYEDTEDSAYGSSDSVFEHGNSFMPSREAAGYENSEPDDVVTGSRNWVIDPALLHKNVSRRRRLSPPRRGGDHASKSKKNRRQRQLQRRQRKRGKLGSTGYSHLDSKEGTGTARLLPTSQSNRSLSYTNSTMRRHGGRSGSATAPHVRQEACVRPGAHVAAGAAAYPHLPASLGALVLLSPGNPTTNPLDKVTRLRRRLLQRQQDEKRDYEKKKQRARHAQGAAAAAEAAATPAETTSPRHAAAAATGSHGDGANPRVPHPVTELKFSFEDLNRSVGPGTARMGAGASLAILRSARQRVRESPRLQEVALKGEAVYVRADPAAAAATSTARRADAGAQSGAFGGKASSLASAEAADGATSAAARSAPRPLRELRDPYTGVVIPSSFAAAPEHAVPAVALSCTAGIPFFHDPTAPRPIAVADIVQPLPLPPAPNTTSEVNSSREASLQTSFCAPVTPPTPTAAYYTLPSSFHQSGLTTTTTTTATAAGAGAGAAQQSTALRRGSANASSSQGSPPTVHFPPPPPISTSVRAAAMAAAAQSAAEAHAAPQSSFATKGQHVEVPLSTQASGASSAASPADDLAARHERTQTETYRDVRFTSAANPDRPATDLRSRRDPFLTCVVPHGNALDPQLPVLDSRVAAATGEYRMPSAIAGGGGARQRWRLHGGNAGPAAALAMTGGVTGGSLDNASSLNLNGNVSGVPPPWRWQHEPLPPGTPFSTTSSISGGSRGGPRRTSGSEPSGYPPISVHTNSSSNRNNNSSGVDGPFTANAHYHSAGEVGGAGLFGPTSPPVVFNLRGFTNACEANWAALRNASPSPRVRGHPGSPHFVPSAGAGAVNATQAMALTSQLPLYPSLVAPYAAPRYPLQQNIRYNAWTADGVSASSGAACVVHVFTVTREMLRNVYEYVAYTCAQRREAEARERERARQRRMKDALAAGVLTRDLQRCLRCPHCGVVGQIAKVAASRNAAGAGASQLQLQRSQPQHPQQLQHQQQQQQPNAPTPRQLSQSVNQMRGMSSSQLGHPSMRVSASVSSFAMETQRPQLTAVPHQPQTERGRQGLASSARQSPRRINMPTTPPAPLPHAAPATSMTGSTAHPSSSHQPQAQQAQQQSEHHGDAGLSDAVVTEPPPHELATDGKTSTTPPRAAAPTEVEEAALHTTASAAESRPTASVSAPTATKEEGRPSAQELDGSGSTAATSPPLLLGGLLGTSSSLPPLPPTAHGASQSRLLSPTQPAPPGIAGDVVTGQSSSFSPLPQHQQQQQPSLSASTSRFVPLGSAPASPPNAAVNTPNKRRPSPTFTATTTTVDSSAEGNADAALEKSCGSRELSQSFVAPQPQRNAGSQPEFQRYAMSSFNASGPGMAATNGLLSSDSHYNLSHPNLPRASQEREESSVRVDSRASDVGPAASAAPSAGATPAGVTAAAAPYHSPHKSNAGAPQHHHHHRLSSNSVSGKGVSNTHDDDNDELHRSAAPNHLSLGSTRRSAMTPPHASCSSLPEGYMTPPTTSFARAGSTSPNQVEHTLGGNNTNSNAAAATAAYAMHILSPSSTSSLPGAANTLPPLAAYGGNSPASSTPPSASPAGQTTRPPQPIHTESSSVANAAATLGGGNRPFSVGYAGSRTSGNASFAGSAPTPAAPPPLAPSNASLCGEAGVNVSGTNHPSSNAVNSSSAVQPRDPFGESMNTGPNRGSFALARRYVCQGCHRDVVPKTSMVSLAQLEDRALSKSVSEAATPTLTSERADNANTNTTASNARANEPFGVLAFEDLLQDDALVHALQTLLQDSIMLPATRPPRPTPAVLTSAIPEATTAHVTARNVAAAPTQAASWTSANPHPVTSELLFSETDGPLKTDMRSPLLPPVSSVVSCYSGRGGGRTNASSIDASRVQLPSALRRSGEASTSASGGRADAGSPLTSVDAQGSSTRLQWPLVPRPVMSAAAAAQAKGGEDDNAGLGAAAGGSSAAAQVPMPSFSRLSLKSSTSSASPSSAASSARSKPAASALAATAADGNDKGDAHSARDHHAASAVVEEASVRKSAATTIHSATHNNNNDDEDGNGAPTADATAGAAGTATATPQLLRLCVPCCGLKVSVLDTVKPPTPVARPPQLQLGKGVSALDGTATPAEESAAPKTPQLRRKSLGGNTNDGGGNGRRMSRKFSCPPLTIPRMREDAATRGLTQSALLMKKETPAAKRNGREPAATVRQQQESQLPQRGRRSSRGAAVGAAAIAAASPSTSRRLSTRRDGRSADTVVANTAATGNSASQELGNSNKTVMKDTDASKRHRVQVNSRMHLDATSIDRIWERVFTKDKSSAVAAVAAGRDRGARAKRLKSFVEEAAHTPPAKIKTADAEAGKSTAEPAHTEAAAAADGETVAARVHQHLGVDLDTYKDASLVLKVELAYPRLPGGNVRQLLQEWVAACQPHPVLIEAVIRNIVYGVLAQLQTLHAAGYTSGNVKSTNVFPTWHLVKATKEAGMTMPPRAAAQAETKAEAETDVKTNQRDTDFEASAGASPFARDTDALRATEPVATKGCSSLKLTLESADRSAPLPPLHSPALSPTLGPLPSHQRQLLQHPQMTQSLSQSTNALQSVNSVSMPGLHALATLATPLMPEQARQQQQQQLQQQPPQNQQPPVVTAYRRTSTKAPLTAAGAAQRAPLAADSVSDPDANRDDENNNNNNESSASQSEGEARRRLLSANASTVLSPSLMAPPLTALSPDETEEGDTKAEQTHEQDKAQHEAPLQDREHQHHQLHAAAPLTTATLSISDALASHVDNSGSGSGVFPFSPALGIASSASYRRARGFSIDDSVVPTGSRRRSSSELGLLNHPNGNGRRASSASGEGGRRRTHSAGPPHPRHRRRSSATSSNNREEDEGEEDLVPLLMEVVAPPAALHLAVGSGVGKSEAPAPQSLMSGAEPASRHAPPRRERYQSTNNSSRHATVSGAPCAEAEARGLRYVRGARLIPPARVLLPTLPSGPSVGATPVKEKTAEVESDDHAKNGTSKAASLTSPTDAGRGGNDSASEEEDSRAERNVNSAQRNNKRTFDTNTHTSMSAADAAHRLWTSGPSGAVPRPKSRRYSHIGGSAAIKTPVASRGSEGEASDREGSSGSMDTVDPLQWSQQVMLVDNLGARVETALRLAMTTLLTGHAPRPARGPTPAKKGAKEKTGKSNETNSRAVSPRERATTSVFACAQPSQPDKDKALNVYVPDLTQSTPPAPPVLFGVQESEYVPAPETIRSARDEAKALWRLWRQQQQQQQQGPYATTSVRGGGERNTNTETSDGDSEEAQMAYVVAQLAEQACPATTLRNTLDPYPYHLAAVDVWQLGMLALDLADGPVPTTWLKQREPTPRLNPYPWSSYFQSFVSQCLQLSPEQRATSAELLHHPWFTVALVPQMTGGGGERSLRDGRLQRSDAALLPLPRMPCVMGVDCLTPEEQAEWEDFDYTLLYANGEGVHPLTAPPASPVSGVVNGINRLRRASATSPSTSGTNAAITGAERGNAAHTSTSTAAGLTAVGDGVGASQSLGTSGAVLTNNNNNNVSSASMGRVGASMNTTNNNATTNNGSINAALMSAVDAEFSAMSSVDLAQYFTRLATLQWRRQQQQQQQQQTSPPTLGLSYYSGGGTNRGGSAANADASWPVGAEARGMGPTVLTTSFFEHSLPISAEDVLAMLRQTSSSAVNTRYLQLGSPRQNLYNIVSPRPPQATSTASSSAAVVAAALGGISQAQQTESVLPTPLLWSHPFNAATGGAAAYGLPSALSAAGATTASPSPPALSASSGGGGVRVGLPPSYVPLRDPRVRSRSDAAVAAGTGGGVPSSAFVSPRWVNVAGAESSLSGGLAVAGPYPSQRGQSSSPLYTMSARESRRRLSGRGAVTTGAAAAGGVGAIQSTGEADSRYGERYDPHWGDLSDGDRPAGGENGSEDGSDGSTSSSNNNTSSSSARHHHQLLHPGDSSDSDSGVSYGSSSDTSSESDAHGGFSVGGQSSGSNSSSGPIFGKAHRAGGRGSSSHAHSSSHSRSFVSSLDDSHLANRGGGEVPYRRGVVVPHDGEGDAEGRPAGGGVRPLRDVERYGSGYVAAHGQAPLSMPAFAPPFVLAPADGAAALRGGNVRMAARPSERAASMEVDGAVDGERRGGRRRRTQRAAAAAASRRRHRRRRRHLLFGTLAASLARLSTVVGSASNSDDDEDSYSYSHSRSSSRGSTSDGDDVTDLVTGTDGFSNERSGSSFPDSIRSGRRRTQNFCDSAWEGLAQHASNPITADAERRVAQRGSHVSGGKSAFTPLSSLKPYTQVSSGAARSSSENDSDDMNDTSSYTSSTSSSTEGTDSQNNVEVQCDELLRCFSALQRHCPMAVSLWCVRMLQQATAHPRTAAAAARLLARVECDVRGGPEARNLGWLSAKGSTSNPLSAAATTTSAWQRLGGEGARGGGPAAVSTWSTAAATAAAPSASEASLTPLPQPTPPPVLDTCPTSFHNYELARWLYAAHQTIPRCT